MNDTEKVNNYLKKCFQVELNSHMASQVVLLVNNRFANAGDKSLPVPSLGPKDHLEKGMATTPVFLPRESPGQRTLVDYGPQGPKQLDVTEVT